MKAQQTGDTVTLTMTLTEARNLEDELLWCRSDDPYSKAVWAALYDLSDPEQENP